MIMCNGNWEKFNDTLSNDLLSHDQKVNYGTLEKSLQRASKEVITKKI